MNALNNTRHALSSVKDVAKRRASSVDMKSFEAWQDTDINTKAFRTIDNILPLPMAMVYKRSHLYNTDSLYDSHDDDLRLDLENNTYLSLMS